MTRSARFALALLVALACAVGSACQLKRPDTVPSRMIEPRLPETAAPARAVPGALPVRLADTQARAHVGRRLLHMQPGGEIVEDPVWRWSSLPDRYLDSALRTAWSSSPDVRLVDAGSAPVVAATLLEWHLDAAGGTRLIGAVEVVITTSDRSVRTQVVRGSETISAELPGDLAAAAGRLLQTLASECLARTSQALR